MFQFFCNFKRIRFYNNKDMPLIFTNFFVYKQNIIGSVYTRSMIIG